jgi:membrane dipeptidase
MVADLDPSLEDVLDHIDYLVQLAGIAHVAVGTDFVSFMGSRFDAKLASADPGSQLYKDVGTSTQTKDIGRFEEVANLVDGLIHRGYNEQERQMILNGNYGRVLDWS